MHVLVAYRSLLHKGNERLRFFFILVQCTLTSAGKIEEKNEKLSPHKSNLNLSAEVLCAKAGQSLVSCTARCEIGCIVEVQSCEP